MLSIVLTMFAPGVGKMIITTAGSAFRKPASRRSSVLSSMLATSASFTGDWLIQPMISLR